MLLHYLVGSPQDFPGSYWAPGRQTHFLCNSQHKICKPVQRFTHGDIFGVVLGRPALGVHGLCPPPTLLAPLLCHREHGHAAARCLRIVVLIVKFRSSAFVVRTLGVKPSSFSASPSRRSLPFLLQDWLHGFRRLFTDTSEHIRFYFLVFLFSTFSLSVSVR